MASVQFSVAELLPHEPPMVLLQTVLGWTDDSALAGLCIDEQTPFFQPGLGVPAHVGIEWMAQLCGVFAGIEAKRHDVPIRLGFLLGTRQYKADRPYFTLGQDLRVAGRLVFRDAGMAVFDCQILTSDDAVAAAAQLTLFQPEDLADIPRPESME